MSDLESMGSIPAAVLGVGLLLAAAWGVAGLLPGMKSWRGAAGLVVRITAGLDLVALLGIGLGCTGVLSGNRALWLLVGLGVLCLPACWHEWGSKGAGKGIALRNSHCLPRAALVPLLGAFLTLGPALCYPCGWDELVYHCVLPRRWLADGWPAVYADLPYSGFPSLGEVLFWLAAPIEALIVSRLLVWVCWMLGLTGLYCLLHRQLPIGQSLWLATVFAVGPATLMVTANCYVEAFLVLHVAAILLSAGGPLCRRNAPPLRAPPVILGVLAGGAAAVKLTGVAFLGLPLMWYAGAAWCGRHWLATARSAALCTAAALCVCVPFYLRPWMLAGNPVSPYFGEWFSNDPNVVDMSRYHHAIGGARFGLPGVAGLVSGPILLSFSDRLYDGSFGWQLIGLLVLGVLAAVSVLRSHRGRVVAYPAAVALWLYLFWAMTAQQARFAVPAVLAWTVVAGMGLRRLGQGARRIVLLVLSVAALISLPWKTAGHYFGSWETVCGIWTWSEYVNDGTGYQYLPLVQAIDVLPDEAQLMLLFEHRGLYLPRPYVIGTPFFQPRAFSPPEEFGDVDRMLAALQRNGITHLVLARTPRGPDYVADGSERLAPLLEAISDAFRQNRLPMVWESETYVVFAVAGGEPKE